VHKYKKAVSTIEYMTLFVLFLAAILVMQKSIARSFFGRWKDLGDSFGQGEQYDPRGTVECGRYTAVDLATGWETTIWYWQPCYECCMDVSVAQDMCKNIFSFNGSVSDVDYCREGDATHPATVEHQRQCCAEHCNLPSKCNFDISFK